MITSNNNQITFTNYYIEHEGCIIDENTKVSIIEYIHRLGNYYDVVLKRKGEEDIILCRYYKELLKHSLFAKYHNGKVLIYYGEFNPDTRKNSNVIKVLKLYDVEDGLSYSTSEKGALKLFADDDYNDSLLESNENLVEFSIGHDKKPKSRIFVR